jgi:thiol-disulfide isomerase/thioredoxin
VDATPAVGSSVTESVALVLYTSTFCDPCSRARAVLAEAALLAPRIVVIERDVVHDAERAEADGIHATPTVIVTGRDGVEVFRATGVPTLHQVLAAAATAI